MWPPGEVRLIDYDGNIISVEVQALRWITS
jgi:hypothetical protein